MSDHTTNIGEQRRAAILKLLSLSPSLAADQTKPSAGKAQSSEESAEVTVSSEAPTQPDLGAQEVANV